MEKNFVPKTDEDRLLISPPQKNLEVDNLEGEKNKYENIDINTIKETFSVSFNNRPKAEIDDIIAFFDNKNGTSPLNGSTAFAYTIPDSNQGGGERTIQVVCESYSQTYSYDDFYSCSATFRRVYES